MQLWRVRARIFQFTPNFLAPCSRHEVLKRKLFGEARLAFEKSLCLHQEVSLTTLSTTYMKARPEASEFTKSLKKYRDGSSSRYEEEMTFGKNLERYRKEVLRDITLVSTTYKGAGQKVIELFHT